MISKISINRNKILFGTFFIINEVRCIFNLEWIGLLLEIKINKCSTISSIKIGLFTVCNNSTKSCIKRFNLSISIVQSIDKLFLL